MEIMRGVFFFSIIENHFRVKQFEISVKTCSRKAIQYDDKGFNK